MKEELDRLQSLIEQLVVRLQNERSMNSQLRNQLAAREAELSRAKSQLNDLRRKVNGLASQFANTEQPLL